jgi:hypothetical protein
MSEKMGKADFDKNNVLHIAITNYYYYYYQLLFGLCMLGMRV